MVDTFEFYIWQSQSHVNIGEMLIYRLSSTLKSIFCANSLSRHPKDWELKDAKFSRTMASAISS